MSPGKTEVLARLSATIEARRGADPSSSHTAKLLAKGPEKCAEKFGEEAIEAIIEAVKGDRAALAAEAADALYHMLVMLAARDVALDDVLAVLAGRAGTSGVAEKAARRALEIARAASAAELADCLALREAVFIDEQGVPPELERDGLDLACEHWIARRDGVPVATARVLLRDDRAKIQRVAVTQAARGSGAGAALMRAMLASLGPRLGTPPSGLTEIFLESQTSAIGFYERLGFAAEGPEFMDAGIPHRRMTFRAPA